MSSRLLDSSALVAASASKKGASAFILGYSKLRKIQTFISLNCLGETRKNVNLKLGKAGRERLVYYLKFAKLRLVPEPSLEKIAAIAKNLPRINLVLTLSLMTFRIKNTDVTQFR